MDLRATARAAGAGAVELNMALFLIPDQITVSIRVALDGPTLALFTKLADQASDRKAAAALAEDVRAHAGALKAAIPQSTT